MVGLEDNIGCPVVLREGVVVGLVVGRAVGCCVGLSVYVVGGAFVGVEVV